MNFGDLSRLAKALQERNDEDFRNGEIHQAILNLGYDEWQKPGMDDWTYGEMIDWVGRQFGAFAAVAVLLGKYNQQVTNNGHAGYWDNRFAGEDPEDTSEHDRMVRGLLLTGLAETELGKPVYENAKRFRIVKKECRSEWGRGDDEIVLEDCHGLDEGYTKDNLCFRWMDYLGEEIRKAIMAELESKAAPEGLDVNSSIDVDREDDLAFPVKMKVDPNRIADLLCAAFDHGIGYWARFRTYMPKNPDWSWCENKSTWENVRKCYVASLCGGYVEITDLEDSENVYKLNRESLLRGLDVMASKYPKHFMDFINENDDSITGDVYIQCCVLGRIVYD